MIGKDEIKEIRQEYAEAKYPRQQISICAQLHDTDEKEILQVLGLRRASDAPAEATPAGTPKRITRCYTPEIKEAAVRAVTVERKSYTKAARELGISRGTVCGWVAAARRKAE